MFIGHNALAFAAKRVAPKTSLGILTAAVMLVDLIWPILLLLGIEHVRIEPGATKFTPLDFYDYPWTHSLLMGIVWGIAFGLIYWAITRYGRGAIIVALGVVSHWILDLIVHRPDLPLWPNGPKFGFGLWNHPAATLIVESSMYIAGVWIYLASTKSRDKIGSISFWSFVVLVYAIYLSTAFGPPPPNARVVAFMGLSAWLLPFWAAWFDRHREAMV
jgi:membrane-bound metal-dependent hydrolase YbcI (DUF457 family)